VQMVPSRCPQKKKTSLRVGRGRAFDICIHVALRAERLQNLSSSIVVASLDAFYELFLKGNVPPSLPS
jgi:hypothetical protein